MGMNDACIENNEDEEDVVCILQRRCKRHLNLKPIDSLSSMSNTTTGRNGWIAFRQLNFIRPTIIRLPIPPGSAVQPLEADNYDGP
jgi:hypothetical protein